MRRIIIILIVTLYSYNVFAQEPGNNLGKTLEQLRINNPDLTYDGVENGCNKYFHRDVDEHGGTLYLWYLYNNSVIEERMYIFDDNDFPFDFYFGMVETLNKSPYRNRIQHNTYWYTYYFSYFSIDISSGIMQDGNRHFTMKYKYK
ncbi:MAG: hypothetical protein J6P44_07920 [Bacteroidales bacterium]|nr:hypothetical protein [Bacteroidales bacterium]